jgi:S1-C subfamily serine protease
MIRSTDIDAAARRQPHPALGFLLLMLALFAAGATGGAVMWWLAPDRSPVSEPSGVSVSAVPLHRLTLSPLVERVAPAVVNIAVLQSSPLENNPLLRDPYYRYFLGVPEEALAPRLSAGSGVIIDAERGLVLTNHHVVQNARAIEVSVGERRVEARLLGSDPRNDIAVLRIRARGLAQLPLGNSDLLNVGDYVVAIGNPFEIGQTVTAGIVSALGRGRRGGAASYVQTDAPINPGNSGGPLINMRGEVIGINTAIVGPGEGNVGIGLAVPSNVARQVMEVIVARAGG